MATKPMLPITELDFFQVKSQLKDFIKNDPSGKFNDLDFEGSNMSVLLDVLAYNTYQNNFYANMTISEMFLESAQLENSIVSHAKELNYLPRSATSARATVSISIDAGTSESSTFIIPKNTKFTTTNAGDRYTFYNDIQHIARRTGNAFVAENIEIFEGDLVDEGFFVNDSRKSIRLLNQNIDVSSITVFENYDQPFDRIEYIFKTDIFGVESTDAVFYVQPSFDGTYEVVFGKDRFGKEPPNNSQIRVFYRISNNNKANGACKFTAKTIANSTVTTISKAAGGAERESLEDIKFFAPKSIQIQERAVTENDYEILLKQRFSEIKDVAVFGGEKLNPPRFGKVAISVNVGGGISDVLTQKYSTFLQDKTPIGIQPVFLPPEFMNVKTFINVFYNPTLTSKSKGELEQETRNLLIEYAKKHLGKFGSIFEISRVSTLIDSLDSSIQYNTIDASPYILYSPNFNKVENPIFDFGTPLESPCRFAASQNSQVFNSFVRSTPFMFDGNEVLFEDNGLGSINFVNARDRNNGIFEFVRINSCEVDYATGVVRLSDFMTESYTGRGIKVSANTKEKNVTSPKTKILLLNDSDIVINMKEVRNK